jgi:hypothetical protein
MDFEEQPKVRQLPEKLKRLLVDERIKARLWNGLMQKMMDEADAKTTVWCSCSRCSLETIKLPRNCFCCQAIGPYKELAGNSCITRSPFFADTCLKLSTLVLAVQNYDYAKGSPIQDPDYIAKNHAALRFAAYRNFIFWAFRKLGKRSRREIPACALHAIRTTFPDDHGQYVEHRE